MSLKTYTNFEQIDRDLQILKLEQKIDFEKMKMNVQDVKESFSPINVVSGIFGNVIRKALILKTVNKLIGK